MEAGESAFSLLREIRQQRGLTLRSAATGVGVAASQLSRMERGERPVGEEIAEKLSRYYNVPLGDIVVSQGDLPPDIVAILRAHPEEVARLREAYRE